MWRVSGRFTTLRGYGSSKWVAAKPGRLFQLVQFGVTAMRELGGIRYHTDKAGWRIALDVVVRLCCHRLVPSVTARAERSVGKGTASVSAVAAVLSRCQRPGS